METPSDHLDPLLAHQDWIRGLARHLLREPAEAEDALQDTWVAALERPPGSGTPLGPWLARVLRNRVRKLRRAEVRRREREQRAARAPFEEQELVNRVEQQQALSRRVLALPEPHRSVLLLHYFEELPVRAIARRQGLPEPAVRQRLKRARERLREVLDRESDGNRSAWSLLLAAWSEPELGCAPTRPWPFRSFPMKTAALLGALLATASGLTWFLRTPASGGAPLAAPAIAEPEGEPHRADPLAVRDPGAGRASRVGAATGESILPGLATLEVVALQAHGRPAAGEWALIETDAPRHPFEEGLRAQTDAEGHATLALPPAWTGIGLLRRGDELEWLELEPGATVRIELALPEGFTVEGRLLDEDGIAIAGGSLWVGEPWSCLAGHVLATTDASGRYRLEGLQADGMHWFGAFAAGHQATPLIYLDAAPGSVVKHDLVLARGGGEVRGRVLDPQGRPAPDAQVLIGCEDAKWARSRGGSPPRRTRTDQEGSFSFVGLRPGPVPLQARRPGSAPAELLLEVRLGSPAEATLRLGPEGFARGCVTDSAGRPVAGAWVERADVAPFARTFARTDAQGRYRLPGLPGGRVRLTARHESLRATASMGIEPPGTVDWSPVLAPAPVVAGRVLDELGRPVVERELSLREAGSFGRGVDYRMTDAEGRFSFGERREVEHVLVIEAPPLALDPERLGRAPAVAVRSGVRPGSEPLEIVLADPELRLATLRGRVVGPDGRPAANAMLDLFDRELGTDGRVALDDDGGFDLRMRGTTLELAIEAEGLPLTGLGRHTLAPGDTLDLGTLALPAPCFAEVALQEAALPEDLRTSWRTADGDELGPGRRAGSTLRSPPLAAGRYELLVQGTGLVSRSLQLEVRAGETLLLPLSLEQATVLSVELGFPPGDHRPGDYRAVALDSAGIERWSRQGRFDPFGPLLLPVSLPEGTFTVEVEVDTGRRAQGALTTSTREGTRLELR